MVISSKACIEDEVTLKGYLFSERKMELFPCYCNRFNVFYWDN